MNKNYLKNFKSKIRRKIMNEKILVIAHRGASKIAPENTLLAFKKAIELNADYIEFDVQITKDDVIVVIHDEDIERVTGHEGLIKEMTLEQLKKIDFGEGEKIPTLKEVISQIGGKIGFNCEIKVEKITQKVISLFQEGNVLESVIISSFLHDELLNIKNFDANVKLASLEPTEYRGKYEWDLKKEMIDFCIKNELYAINPLYSLVDEKFVEYAHDNGIKVFPWTVDTRLGIKKMIKSEADGIITNDVEKTIEIINQLTK